MKIESPHSAVIFHSLVMSHGILGMDLLKMSRDTLLLRIVAIPIAYSMKAVYNSGCKFAGRYAPLKENVEFSKCPALGFRKAEESPDEAAKASCSIEETALGAPIPRTRIEHAWGDDVTNDGSKVVKVPRYDDRLLSKASRGDFRND